MNTDQVREDAIVLATALQSSIYQQQGSLASGLPCSIRPIIERYAPQNIQTSMNVNVCTQEAHQEILEARRREEIEDFALHAPKFP